MKNGYSEFFKQAQRNRSSERQAPAQPESAKLEDHEVEQKLKEIFNLKSREKTSNKRKQNAAPSSLWISVVAALTLISLIGYLTYDLNVLDLLPDKIEFGFLEKGSAADGVKKLKENAEEKASVNSPNKEETAASDKNGNAEVVSTQPTFSDEEISYFSKLNERKRELDQREKELNELESELHKQKVEIEARIDQLRQMRREIASVLEDRVELDVQKVGKLVDFYSNMKPAQAAKILSGINEDLAVQVLSRMKKRNAAEIMNLLSAEKARTLSEKFTGYMRE